MRYFLLVISFIIFSTQSFAAEQKEEKLNAGEMIMEHISDAHEWHIVTLGEKHISIPLPIILIHNGKINVFMSSKFHHGTEVYNGFKLETEGKNKGKIIHVNANIEPTDQKVWDFSITKNAAALMISVLLITGILFSVKRSCLKHQGKAPKGLQSLLEILILFVRDDIVRPVMGIKGDKYMPFLLTVFFFILVNNLLGLIPLFPGGANVTGNIAVTGVLAIFTFFVTTFSGNKHYWKDIVNTPGVPWWLKIPIPLMPVVEILSMFTKPFVLMVRLFANITAGHIIILGFMSMIFIFGSMSKTMGYGISVLSVLFSLFISMLELLVAFIQAYVFVLLSTLYIGMATHNPDEEHA